MAYAARNQRICTFKTQSENIEGWVVGVDDYHYQVVSRFQEVVLVHKSCPVIVVGSPLSPTDGSTADRMLNAFVTHLNTNK